MQDLEIKNKTLREENTLLRNTLIGKENTIRKQEKDEISARRKAFGTEEEKQKKESDLSSLATTTKITRMQRRTNHYDDFIRWTFNNLLEQKKIINPNEQNNFIILDASIIMDPDNPPNFDHLPLMNTLNNIKKKKYMPLIYETLIYEYRNLGRVNDMTIFPALEMAEYFHESIQISDKSQNILALKQKIMEGLSSPQRNRFVENSTQGGFENDILHAAVSKRYRCPLITNDKALLELGLNPNNNLKIYHITNNRPDYSNYPHINRLLNQPNSNDPN